MHFESKRSLYNNGYDVNGFIQNKDIIESRYIGQLEYAIKERLVQEICDSLYKELNIENIVKKVVKELRLNEN